MKTIRSVAVSGLLLLAAPASAAPEEVLLWPRGAPGSEGKTAPEKPVVRENDDGLRRIASIHKPSLTVYLPAKGTATGAAVIILPGGGHRYLAIDNEGHQVARWLSEKGVAGLVLKYRLAREDGSTYKVEEHAVKDAQRALRLARSRAKGWGLDPQRIGLIGFSAGAQIVSHAAGQYDVGDPKASDPVDRESARPAFQALVYGGARREGQALPKDAPPAFICVAADDKGPTGTAVQVFQKLQEAGVNAELHIFSKGGHGFGMKTRPLAVSGWPSRFQEWLADQGFLKASQGSLSKAP
jgi:acetyl esterase/lipase